MVKVPSAKAIVQAALKLLRKEADIILAGRTTIDPFAAGHGELCEVYIGMLVLLHAIEYLEGKYRD